ncbi:MAG: hypothetical protein QOF44_5035, partial [Streptomyces sp.]|nr:hypothetical protein [Streptomyces sp.]
IMPGLRRSPSQTPGGGPPADGRRSPLSSCCWFGGFLLGIGWVVGLVLLWSSRRWTPIDKLLGTLLVPGGLALPVLAAGGLLFASSESCSSDSAQAGKRRRRQPGPGYRDHGPGRARRA